jgi:peroxiredoxin (alkyl hydroperoxide reductase subunit C)
VSLKVGDEAPDFNIPSVTGEEKGSVRLSDYRGKKNVVIAFYAADWTPVCTAQIPAYNADIDKFTEYDTQIIGISADSIFSHIAWQKRDVGTLKYPLASDFYPHGEVAKKYGVLREGDPLPGISQRAVFVVDKRGHIAMARIYELGQQPDNEDVFEVLRKLEATAAKTA